MPKYAQDFWNTLYFASNLMCMDAKLAIAYQLFMTCCLLKIK